jgi:hypothetical protein
MLLILAALSIASPAAPAPAPTPFSADAAAAAASLGKIDASTVASAAQASRPLAPARYADAGPALPPGVARTQIDYRFAPRDMVGSLGYLCGLEPGPNEAGGPVSASDPVGTFLGAKLSLAFR